MINTKILTTIFGEKLELDEPTMEQLVNIEMDILHLGQEHKEKMFSQRRALVYSWAFDEAQIYLKHLFPEFYAKNDFSKLSVIKVKEVNDSFLGDMFPIIQGIHDYWNDIEKEIEEEKKDGE